jgi:predicted NAD/FAD-binding protein
MKVGVIGGGVAGLSAVWSLNEHSNHDVHLFEANEYVGGHTNTVLFRKPGEPDKSVMVDTGFIVFNEVTYPNFLAFVKHLGFKIIASDMSFSVTRTAPLPQPKTHAPFTSGGAFPSVGLEHKTSSKEGIQSERGAFEWAGTSPLSLFSQWSNLFDPDHWRMVWDIIRFNHQSVESLAQFDRATATADKGGKKDAKAARFAKQSIGDWLRERGYSKSFSRNYLVPVAACIWSTPAGRTANDFPALTLLRFMHNHHLLQILDRPQWLTIQGGWKTYVDRVLEKLPAGHLHKGKRAGKVVEATFDGESKQWLVSTADGHIHSFDRIIFAAHADQTSRILASQLEADEKSRALKAVLNAFEFNKNSVLLHTDDRIMPVRRSAWSAWNFTAHSKDGKTDVDGVVLTYWMNLLQSLDEQKYGPVLVTLNAAEDAAAPEKRLARIQYEHPVYTARSVNAQRELKQSWQGTWHSAYFAGAWTNYGFHEDGFSSGIRAAYALGATPPFDIRDAERTTAMRHYFRLSTRSIQSLEHVRRRAASLTLLLLAPLMVIAAILAETLANAIIYVVKGGGVRCGTRNELRRVRVAWEPYLSSSVINALSQPSNTPIKSKKA